MVRLLADSTPDTLLHQLNAERERQPGLFNGIHLYSFGGFLRTAATVSGSKR